MNDIEVKIINAVSHIEHEDYFPLRVVYDVVTNEVHHIGFYNGDEDLLELAVANDTGNLKSIQVTICNHYSIVDSCLDYNNINITNEETVVQLSDHNDCTVFDMTVYNNCIAIKLSEKDATDYVKSGQVLFGIDNINGISRILVTDISQADVNHLINELSYQ